MYMYVLMYGTEAWIICKGEENRITPTKIKFTRRTTGYISMDHKINTNIVKELNTETISNSIQTYRAHLKLYVRVVPR
jgi:hypothetical protein